MATITVTCPHCGTTYEQVVKNEFFGKKVRFTCKNQQCKKQFIEDLPDEPTLPNIIDKKQYLKLEVVADENTKSQSFMVNQEFTVIGRKNTSGPEFRPDVAIDTSDRYMSRKHCVIQRNVRNKFTIKDNGAKNQTWLNDKPLSDMDVIYLKDGDDIRIGHTHVKVRLINIESPKPQNGGGECIDDENTI